MCWGRYVVVLCMVACGTSTPSPFDGSATSSGGASSSEDGSTAGSVATGETGSAELPDLGGSEPKLDIGPPAPTTGEEALDCDTVGQLESSLGCSFWAVDLPNSTNPGGGGPAAEDQQFAVVVANAVADDTAHVVVRRGAAMLEEADVAPGELHVFALPSENIDPHATTTGGRAFRVESDLPVAAYQFNPLDNVRGMYSSDASMLVPEHALAEDYVAITSEAANVLDGDGGAFVSVVGTADGTRVDLYPTSPIHPGTVTDVEIDRGEVLTIVSIPPPIGSGAASTMGSLAGTRIAADAPVAVFAGNVCGKDPAWLGFGACDHLEQQMLPLSAWGSTYAATLAPSRVDAPVGDPTVFRITGAFDATELSYSPAKPAGAPDTIDAYETVGFMTDAPFTVTSADPFALTHFVVGTGAIDDDDNAGDPAMLLVPSVEQLQHRYVYLVPEGYDQNYTTVAGPADATFVLDGVGGTLDAPVGDIGGQAWASIHLSSDPGPHTLEADAPVLVTVTSYSTFISYAYPAGTGASPVSPVPDPPG